MAEKKVPNENDGLKLIKTQIKKETYQVPILNWEDLSELHGKIDSFGDSISSNSQCVGCPLKNIIQRDAIVP